jgi:hypothetical protein
MLSKFLRPSTGIGFALLLMVSAAKADDVDVDTGRTLAALLQAGLATISSHQDTINDPTVGPKGLTGKIVAEETITRFETAMGYSPLGPGLSERDRRLAAAQIDAMMSVVDDYREVIDVEGVGFKGFIPSLFGRISNERFGESVGHEVRVKITAPAEFVRNRRSRPDGWESDVMETRFEAPDWPRGDAFYASVEAEGRTAFRMMIPTYYQTSCLACHGQPKGALDVTGYPKEGGADGQLGGAISITIFR